MACALKSHFSLYFWIGILSKKTPYVDHLKKTHGIQIAGPAAEKSEVLDDSIMSQMLGKLDETL